MFSIKEHLILVLVGILFETFDELGRTEPFFSNVGNSCLGIYVSFSVYDFLEFVGHLEPELYDEKSN